MTALNEKIQRREASLNRVRDNLERTEYQRSAAEDRVAALGRKLHKRRATADSEYADSEDGSDESDDDNDRKRRSNLRVNFGSDDEHKKK